MALKACRGRLNFLNGRGHMGEAEHRAASASTAQSLGAARPVVSRTYLKLAQPIAHLHLYSTLHMSQDAHGPERDQLLQPHSQDESDPEESFPPSYEEAIGHIDEESSATNLQHQTQQSIPPNSSSSSNVHTQAFNLNDEIQNSDSDEADEDEERAYQESSPLKAGQIPDTHAQQTFMHPSASAAGASNPVSSSAGGHGSPFGHQHQDYPIQPLVILAQPDSVVLVDLDLQACLAPYRQAGFHMVLFQGSLRPQNLYFRAPALLNAQEVSIATFTRSKRGVESQDALLDDPYQLYRFFVAHNDRPSMHVLITGSHMEKQKTEERNSDGTSAAVEHKVKVNDFKMDFDLSPYISPAGTIMTLPDPKTGNKPTLREVMEEHVEEENPFKELHMEKRVNWDYEDLTRAITQAIRSVNYRYTIEISYPIFNNKVVVHSSSPLATFMRSAWTKALCVISVVGIAMYPLREMYKKVKDKSLQSEFQMTISTREFYMANYWNIVDQVQYK
ncbi:hypothetical protein BGZ68_009932 [Mortierella alpina]|nr:hypothetical protein BGZ68_009932 [Mortierella alpina]